MKSINPFTGQLIMEYREHTIEETGNILQKADGAWKTWKETGFSYRAGLFKKVAEILLKNKDEYARLMTSEMGKLFRESVAEVEKCAYCCDFYADHARDMLKDEVVSTDAVKSYVMFQPLGVILAVMPWNFPFWQVFRFAAPTLMAGNVAVLKHASNVPGCAQKIEEIFRLAGFPEHVFSTLMITSDKVEQVIANPVIKAVTLTGSEEAGIKVAATSGKYLKKTVLELGGADPFIVLEDADIEYVSRMAVTARMINMGQSCIAAKRFIVQEKIAGSFEKAVFSIMEMLKAGDPMAPETQVGPLARPDLVEDIDAQVQRSIQEGARLVLGGKKIQGACYFYQPTILADVKRGMTVYSEETFGPVLSIITCKNDEEAIEMANDSSFGLGGSIWTNDVSRSEQIARQIETGNIFVNGMTRSDPRLPFGGIKKSGYGRELSHFGIREFVNIKTVVISP
ncbi:MAG: NAD-dependent succinate-semialdehyde dehydrogenase [Bacteroidetes bacterium]|nr:NAD-dependent succinate-semialdehyde dehydrogenase [Bacteroidota bacterium]